MPAWLIIVGLVLLVALAVWVFLSLTANWWVVSRGLEPGRLQDYVQELLEVLTDQSELVVQRDHGENRLRLVKHVETESVTDLYLSLAENEWNSLDAAAERLSRQGVPCVRKPGFPDGERLQVHGIENARRAVDLILLLFELDWEAPQARFTVHFEGHDDLRLVSQRSRRIRAGKN